MKKSQILDDDDTISYEITPEIAKAWLAKFRYDGQRPVSQPHVEFLVSQIEAGRLRFSSLRLTGYPIEAATGADGKPQMCWHLTNGQHRLNAIIQSGTTARFGVERVKVADAEEVARDYAEQDNIRNRTASEAFTALSVGGESDLTRSQIAALHKAVRVIYSDFSRTAKQLPALKSRVALAEAMEPWIPATRAMFACVEGSPVSNIILLSSAPVFAPALATFASVPAQATEFWGAVAADDGLKAGDPRRTLLYFLRDTPGRERELLLMAVAQCWAAFCEKRSLAKCTFVKGERFSLLRTPWEAA